MEEIPSGGAIALHTVQRFVDLAVDALGEAREEIDALNVYPVPDGDTGTNLHLTLWAAREALREGVRADADAAADAAADGSGAGTALAGLARGALLGARGNSGVILAEVLGAIARRIGDMTAEETSATVVAQAFDLAARRGYAAVDTPVEGTMLSVLRAAADAGLAELDRAGAQHRGDPDRVRASQVVVVAAAAAREALALTPTQLPVLAAAGVVDAGGRGLCVLLDAAETAMTGRRPRPAPPGPQIPVRARAIRGASAGGPDTDPSRQRADEPDGGRAGPAYEVMFLLDADDGAVVTLRERLGVLGDSLVVIGGDGLWNVHVHVDDAGAAVEAGIEAGRPHRVRITHLPPSVRGTGAATGAGGPTGRDPGGGDLPAHDDHRRGGRAVIAVAAGPGLAALFSEAGAGVVRGGPGKRPSAGALLEAILGSGAAEVVVLPNDPDSAGAARIAAETAHSDHDVRVAVVPTDAQVQGLAALAVHEPGRSFDQDVLEMTATARHVRHGATTLAARRAMTMGGPCEPGDVLGVVAGDFAVVGQDLEEVAVEVVRRLVAGGGELVTIVAGTTGAGDGPGGLAEEVARRVRDEHPYLDVMVYDGGQERYPLLLSVE